MTTLLRPGFLPRWFRPFHSLASWLTRRARARIQQRDIARLHHDPHLARDIGLAPRPDDMLRRTALPGVDRW